MIGAEDEVRDALSDELARLTGNARFAVAEFGAIGPTIWRVYRDENGTPRAEQPRVRASALKDPDAFYREVDPAFIVMTAASLPDDLLRLLPGERGVPVYECRTPLEDQVREAIRDSPLVLGYELAVLRQVPGRPDAGRLVLTGHQLFPPGVTQGHRTVARIRCEPTDGDGTIFAVVTRDRRPDVPPNAQPLRPVHVQSALVPADTYEVTAVLDPAGPRPAARAARSAQQVLRLMGQPQGPGTRPAGLGGAGPPGVPGRGQRRRRPARAQDRPAVAAHRRSGEGGRAAERLRGGVRAALGRVVGGRAAGRRARLGGTGRQGGAGAARRCQAARRRNASTGGRPSLSAHSTWSPGTCPSVTDGR